MKDRKSQKQPDAVYYDHMASVYKEIISGRIMVLRIKNKISQKQLGEYLSVTSQAITMMERGKRTPSFEILCKLADYFDVSLDYLTGRSDNPNSHKL